MSGNRHPDQTPVVGEVRRITVGFDKDTFLHQQSNQAPFYPGEVTNTTARVLEKDVVLAKKRRNGLGRHVVAHNHGNPSGFTVLNNYGNIGQTKNDLLNELTFLGLAQKPMECDAIESNTNINTAVNVQGHDFGYNRSAYHINMNDPIMWDIPDNVEDAKRHNRAAGKPTDGGYPEARYTAFLRPYIPSEVASKMRQDFQSGLGGERTAMTSVDGAINSIRKGVTIGILLAGVLIPQYGQDGAPPTADGFIQIVRAIMSGAPDQNVDIPDTLDDDLQGAMREMLFAVQNGALDAYISTLLTPTPTQNVIRTKRVPPQTTNQLRYVHEIQRNFLSGLLLSIDNVFKEGGRDRVIGRALESAAPGSDFGIMLYGK
jgi:hypothetical protein